MKKIILLIVCVVIIAKLSPQEASQVQFSNKIDNLKNSLWTFKIDSCCINYYRFNEYRSYVFYSGERDEYFPGVYSIKKDTLFLREFSSDEDDPFELLDREVKFVALLKKNSFQLLYREDQIRTKEGHIIWMKTILDERPIFLRTNKLSNKKKSNNK